MLGIMGEKMKRMGFFWKKEPLSQWAFFFKTPQKVKEKRCWIAYPPITLKTLEEVFMFVICIEPIPS